jgi:hypothetical protein
MNVLNHPSIASEWLSGLDLDGKSWDVVIAGVAPVTVPDRNGKTEEVLAVAFRLATTGVALRKRLLLRPTTAKQIAKLHGIESDNWIGKGIVIRPENVQAFGATHCCVRVAGAATVRMHKPAETPAPAPAASELYVPAADDADLWADAPVPMAA